MKNSETLEYPPEAIAAESDFNVALAAVQKMVNIKIDKTDFEILKKSGYKLCFAKRVGNHAFNVVWQSYSDYLMNNSFSWTPLYQLFGSNKFKANLTVSVSTNLQTIELGQTSVLNPQGFLGAPTTAGPKTAFTLNNEYGPIHPGVNQISTGINGHQISTPIYVAVDQVVIGNTKLTPVDEVLVWFEQNIETSTMFSDSRSKAVIINLTSANTETREYKNGSWITP